MGPPSLIFRQLIMAWGNLTEGPVCARAFTHRPRCSSQQLPSGRMQNPCHCGEPIIACHVLFVTNQTRTHGEYHNKKQQEYIIRSLRGGVILDFLEQRRSEYAACRQRDHVPTTAGQNGNLLHDGGIGADVGELNWNSSANCCTIDGVNTMCRPL